MTDNPIAPPLAFEQFERIFQSLYSALDERALIERSCVFFAFAGSLILQEHYGIDCRACAGAVLLNIGDDANTVITFGSFDGGLLSSNQDSFHCWIETEEFAVDFMSPIYRENMIAGGGVAHVPRNSFIRPISAMVTDLKCIVEPGSFALQHNPDLTNRLVDTFCEHELSLELLSACKKWFRPYPFEMPNTVFPTESGRMLPFYLHGHKIDGSW